MICTLALVITIATSNTSIVQQTETPCFPELAQAMVRSPNERAIEAKRIELMKKDGRG